MAQWDKISSRGDVEDRRGATGLAAGSVGVIGLVVLLLQIFGGNNPTVQNISSLLTELDQSQVQSQQTKPSKFDDPSNYQEFAATVLGSNNDTWKPYVEKNSQVYTPPHLVLFRNATKSGCGTATSEIGPHYCPADKTIYLDETFFDALTKSLGAKGGDVAEAYVIGHEVGHHIQNELGIMDQIDYNSNNSSIKLELQADCFAGVWAHSIANSGIFDQGEISEAIDAAASVGDDRIQKSYNDRIDPESWTHGSSEQRVEWFNVGYKYGQPAKCDTFQ